MNTYLYVSSDPLNWVDPEGLHKKDKWWGRTDREFQRWFHKCWKQPGDPDANQDDIEEAYAYWLSRGSPKNGKCDGTPPPPPAVPSCGDDCKKVLIKTVRDSATGAVLLIWAIICWPFAA